MAYKLKEERRNKLESQFREKNAERLAEYEILSRYEGWEKKMEFRHRCGHCFWATPRSFATGHGCPECAKEQRKLSLKKTKGSKFLDYLKAHPEYELVDEYVNNTTRIRIRHNDCGTITAFLPSTFYLPSNREEPCLCRFCKLDMLRKKFQYTLEQANHRLEKVNPEYEFITYNGAKEDATVRHKVCGEEFIQSAKYLLLGDGHCPKCTTHVSKGEREVYEWVKRFVPDAVQSYHGISQVWEVDIYCPTQKVAIQFNGHYWHGEQKQPNHHAHYEQSKYCRAEGVRLIHVWDYEWNNPRQQAVLKNIILGALHMLPERYYARECEVKCYRQGDMRWQELNRFFAENNIQGNRGGSVVFTLEKEGRVLMAYKFGRPSGGKAKEKYEWEMVRGAAAPSVQVVGGATRLWQHFLKEMKPRSVVYYVDFNYFDGVSVEKLGGRYAGHTASYKNYWVKKAEVKNREPSKHKEIKALEAKGEVYKIWNAGVLKYEFFF